MTGPAGPDDEHARTGLRLGVLQERRLRQWPKERIRPKGVALGVISLLAEIDHLRADLAAARESEARWLGFLRNVHDDLETGGTSLEELRTARRLLLQDLRRALEINAQEARP